MSSAKDPTAQLSLLDLERLQQPKVSDAERIVAIAARVIAELDERPPISLEVVASYRDILDIEVGPLPHAGSLTPEGKRLVMRLNSSDSNRRRRFTGFHEVGHTFQPGFREGTLFRCASPALRRSGRDPEALADVAAAELLLPSDYFEPDTLEGDFDFASVLQLADLYEASVQATAYRFSHFWDEPSLVVALQLGLRKAERGDPEAVEKLRAVSSWPSSAGVWPYVPRNKSAIETGALKRAYDGELIRESAGLEELELDGPSNVELTARAFDYRRGGRLIRRVLAMFRRVET